MILFQVFQQKVGGNRIARRNSKFTSLQMTESVQLFFALLYGGNRTFDLQEKKLPFILGIVIAILGVLAVFTNLGATYPWLTIGIPALPSLYFDWFGGCIQAFIFCTLTTLFIKQASDG